ncbi:hypothetical protein RKE25_19950 [Dyella sp. BiH032]|uniref:hypothetical protein n=1 Tax=Dyella sp. BiH032 TaxID=3075430 RepID=UPI00289300BA|nr:hypothetical protein [Dyella sp. BiH032]WNL45659.1 hypothetical protein RKE25_19950 [Dyella sp. BiH032]
MLRALLPLSLLLVFLELLHGLLPLRATLFHRRIQCFYRIDVAEAVIEVVTDACWALGSPQSTSILTQGDLVDSL